MLGKILVFFRRPGALPPNIKKRENAIINGSLETRSINSHVIIGMDCLIEDEVLIAYQSISADSNNHGLYYDVRKKDLADWCWDGKSDWGPTKSASLKISQGTWIGARSIILKGVTVGEGSAVSAGPVVIGEASAETLYRNVFIPLLSPFEQIMEIGIRNDL